MKVRPSHQPGHVVFDVGGRDIALLANAESLPEVISTVVEQESFFLTLRQTPALATVVLAWRFAPFPVKAEGLTFDHCLADLAVSLWADAST
jgi:hypothetical protein